MRKLYIIGDISWENYEKFTKGLTHLEEQSNEEVFIELASDGGDAHAALAFSSRMRLSPCNLIVTGLGNIASAAVLILASGDHRKLAKEAWVMVHEDQAEISGNVVSLERESLQLRKMETQWAQLLGNLTTTSANTWTTLHKKTTYLSPAVCVTYGLADEVV